MQAVPKIFILKSKNGQDFIIFAVSSKSDPWQMKNWIFHGNVYSHIFASFHAWGIVNAVMHFTAARKDFFLQSPEPLKFRIWSTVELEVDLEPSSKRKKISLQNGTTKGKAGIFQYQIVGKGKLPWIRKEL